LKHAWLVAMLFYLVNVIAFAYRNSRYFVKVLTTHIEFGMVLLRYK